jgi:DNA polymerase III subunit epsilon
MYLFFDTETTGLPLKWKAPVRDLANWPRLVQAAWILDDDEGNEISGRNYIVRPDGFSIPEVAARIHGITTERAMREGRPLSGVLRELGEIIASSEFIVGHNIDFDEKIVGAEFLRNGMKNFLEGKEKICTMKCATEYCAIENRFGYKWPKLSELHYQLFGKGFDEAHNAAADIRVTAKCFWEMKRRGIC